MFQDNLEGFINNPSYDGQAQKEMPKIDRPNWDEVKEVLQGIRPVSDLGCE